ncbi:F-actin-capping protein subunit alpha-2 [Fasciolopsis buskii]|uniref:F-actin-capping protein subunit alpha n=1 Tax=Fasciolopsis buskii TaxID=27845 RepID=A0A8E0S5M6_9TREM|nr:F-actin-capping protein subunit alpha-2 [Fasciolopsis buski]
MVDECVTAEDRACVCARLALLAPPCEFPEVLDDIRAICPENPTVQKKLVAAAAQYNRDQMLSVRLPNAQHSSLVTVHGDLGGGYFLCPRNHVSFHFDHLNQTVGDVNPLEPNDADGGDVISEPWRLALETAITEYTMEHFPRGTISVYAPAVKNDDRRLIACIESHFSKHQSTGRWRSEWTVLIPDDPSNSSFKVHGILKVQTHLYEEGNVQLISCKEIDFTVNASNAKDFAKACVKQIREADVEYQVSIANYKSLTSIVVS